LEIALRKLRDQSGEISLKLPLILLVGVILLVIVLNARHAFQCLARVQDGTNEAVLAVAALNGPAADAGVREGNAVVRRYTGAGWARAVSSGDVLAALQQTMGGTVTGGSLFKEGSFRIDDLVTTFVNVDGGYLHFKTTLKLTIFLMGGSGLAVSSIPLEVFTTYEPKF